MSSSDEGSGCIEGYLWRNVMIGYWPKRFCRLENNQFKIYKNKKDKNAEITINMSTKASTEIIDSTNSKFRISINNSVNDKSYIYLQASDKNEMMKWILDLRGCAFTNPQLSMDMFKIIAVIGRGNYGKVMLCQKKDTQEILAIKTVHKSRLVKANKLYTILTERNILFKVKNPFIISLKYAFQTVSKFYMCLEYAPGGDLFHLMAENPIPLDDIKLYIAEISIALECLHQNGVIYRDLKPENILFDEKGHIKLTDFGLSKDFVTYKGKSTAETTNQNDSKLNNGNNNTNENNEYIFNESDQTTSTFCGTTEYIAPEMIKKKGYSFEIDWWGLGVVAYEMFFGRTPFEAGSKKQVYQNILNAKPYYEKGCDPDVKEFLESLLDRRPKKRGNLQTIMMSKLFKNFDFNAVKNKQIPPLYSPKVGNLLDIRNFDSQFTKELAVDSAVNYESSAPMVSNFSYSCLCEYGSIYGDQQEHTTTAVVFPELIPIEIVE